MESSCKKEQVFLTVEYEKRYLNVWRQDSHGYSKFYVTPLCVMEIDSINCLRDEYSHAHRHIFGFNIKLWDSKATKVVQNALKQMNVNSSLSNILPLPMEMVRIGLGGTNLTVEVDNQWRSNQDQPHVMDFEFYTRHEHFCNKMISDAKNNTKHFLRAIKPYFEFMMVVRQHETRNFNVTGKSLQNSSFFSELANNTDNKDGIVFLQSKDLNRLTHNIYNKVAFEEEVSADYISSNQEKEIINELFEVLKNQQIQSKDLTKNEWNSVFWEDIYARPDIQADYANEVLKYNENENKFKYDSEKDQKFRENINRNKPKNKKVQKEQFNWFGELFPLGKFPNENKVNNENGEDTKKNEKETVSFDDLKKTLNKENINVKWNGIKFEPKNLKLYRLNTKKLNLSNGLYFKSIVVTNQKTIQQKIEIKAEPKIMLPLTTVMNTEIKSAASNLNPSICPDSWIYYNTTGFCYKVIRQNTTWGDAEKLCVEKESHLASVHSYNENLFITYLANDFTTICDWSGQAWIGLSRADVTSLNFEWTDGSLYGYKSWIRGDSHGSKNNCAALWIGQSCYGENWSIAATHWNPYPCDSKVKNVICKKAPNIQTKNDLWTLIQCWT
uniref:C-type lectin domain-containing protein n=1 Tax=Panagrolaimus superbus TaxID=310955 RepID=A0A914YP38_9BILA